MSNNAICREFEDSERAGPCAQKDYKHDDIVLATLENTIEYMASLLESNQCATTILKNQIVSRISSDENKISVLTAGGDAFDASYILSTIPLGVLQRSTSIFQESPLPYPLEIAIKNFEMVKASIVHLHSNLSIPDPYYTIPIDIKPDGGGTVDILNLNAFTGDDIIVLQASHEVAAILETLNDS